MLALALLRIEIFLFALRQNLDRNQNLDQQIILPKKIFPKNFKKSQNILPENPKKFPKNIISKKLKQFLKKFLTFGNIQFPRSYKEAENPFGLVFKKNIKD